MVFVHYLVVFLVKVQYREALNLFDENRNHLEKSEDRTPGFIEVFPAWFIFFLYQRWSRLFHATKLASSIRLEVGLRQNVFFINNGEWRIQRKDIESIMVKRN